MKDNISQTDQELGRAIRRLRRQACLSQAMLAGHFGVTYQQWQKYESGRNRVSAILLYGIAKRFGVEVRSLFVDPEIQSISAVADMDRNARLQQTNQLLSKLSDADYGAVNAIIERLSQRSSKETKDNPIVPLVVTAPRCAIRILLVDDDEDGLRMTARMLGTRDYVVTLASNGDQAFTELAKRDYDVIISDYAMPGMNGAALLELALERQPGLAAIIITGYATDAGISKLPAGTRVVPKPFSRDEIVFCLEAALNEKRTTYDKSLVLAAVPTT